MYTTKSEVINSLLLQECVIGYRPKGSECKIIVMDIYALSGIDHSQWPIHLGKHYMPIARQIASDKYHNHYSNENWTFHEKCKCIMPRYYSLISKQWIVYPSQINNNLK